ncbi:MAG: hypothetical protein H6R32_170 [Candidatus Aminicenantes bacterium]|nr:hypothetical protein [Candidatus Aminicenantes bacterium]
MRLLTGGEEVFLTLDGQRGRAMAANDTVVQLVTSPKRSYYDLVKEKLGWAE